MPQSKGQEKPYNNLPPLVKLIRSKYANIKRFHILEKKALYLEAITITGMKSFCNPSM